MSKGKLPSDLLQRWDKETRKFKRCGIDLSRIKIKLLPGEEPVRGGENIDEQTEEEDG